jgi:prolipoprotein diacylglyceryltransferase
VIGQWESEFAGQPFWKVFATWEGGLAIMGGALFGALAGILFIVFRRKDITLRHAADIGVPVILIAKGLALGQLFQPRGVWSRRRRQPLGVPANLHQRTRWSSPGNSGFRFS